MGVQEIRNNASVHGRVSVKVLTMKWGLKEVRGDVTSYYDGVSTYIHTCTRARKYLSDSVSLGQRVKVEGDQFL